MSPSTLLTRLLPALFVLASAANARAQHHHVLVEPTDRTGWLPGAGAFPIDMVWKLGCVGDANAVDRETFLGSVQVAKDLLAANALGGGHGQLAPQGGQSLLTSFDLQFTLSGTPPPVTAAVAELETYFEARLGSTHASGGIPITIQWGALPAGVLMNTGLSWAALPYSTVRANWAQGMDPTDALPAFLPAGPTYPVRFDGTTNAVTNVSDVNCSLPWIAATFPGVTIGPGPQAIITVTSAFGWDFDPTNGIGAGYCFKSALAHEIVHALGFASDIDLGTGVPTQLDLLRFQNSANRPALFDYLAFGTQARLLDANTPDDDVQLNLGAFSYRMEDGAPNQGSHFKQATPPIGVMQPELAISTTYWPDYLREPDLRALDALGYDWVDPALAGLARMTGLTPIDENPNSSTSVRFKATFNERVVGVGTADFQIDGFMGTGITSVVPLEGNAASFDGLNWYDLENLPEITGIGTQKFAIDVWIRPTVQPASGAPKRHIFSAGSGNVPVGSSMWLYLDSNNRLRFDATGDSFGPTLPVLNDGDWHHITVNSCCGTNATVQIIVDFTTSLIDTLSIDIQPGSACIGRSLASSPIIEGFVGEIDDFRFLGTTVVPSQAEALRPTTAFQNEFLLAYLPFDTAGGLSPYESWNGGYAAGVAMVPHTYPAAVPGIVDSATEFAVTIGTTMNSGLLYPEFVDDNSIREARSGAAHNGPDAGAPWSFDFCTMQHQSGVAYCEGASCPCANNPPQGTWVGCLSSIAQGARLRSTGSQSISAANLTLQGSQMSNSNALYLAGNAQANSVLGDGIFCIGGTIVRLGTKSNAAGASQFPDVGQVPIATRVSAIAGQTSYFTVWYRNAAAFCTPATFNDSNGWRVTWTP